MSHIKKFAVSGLAGRKDTYECTLDRHVNVFFGLNGSGKTSLLRLLDSAMNGDASTLAAVPFHAAEVHVFSESYKQLFVRTIDKPTILEALRNPSGQTSFLADPLEIRRRSSPTGRLPWTTSPPDPPDFKGAWAHSFLPISRMYSPPKAAAATWEYRAGGLVVASDAEEMLNDSFADTVKQIWSTYFNGLLQEVRNAQSQGLANILKAVLAPKDDTAPSGRLDPDAAYRNLASFLRRQGSPQILPTEKTFKKRYVEDSELRSVVSDIDEVENRIAAAMAPRAKLQDLIGRLFSGGKSIAFDDRGIEVRLSGEASISLGLLSSGEKQILRLLIEVLRVGPSSLLVDEPELSMHIDWQRELIGSMRSLNPDTQIIAATHSPEIMAEIEDTNIFRI